MTFRRWWSLAILVVAVLTFPQAGSAQGWGGLFELSGPPAHSFYFSCKFLGPRPFTSGQGEDRLLSGASLDACWGEDEAKTDAGKRQPHAWIRFENEFYVLERTNDIRVVGFAPGFMFEGSPVHPKAGRAVAFAGIGVQWFHFWDLGGGTTIEDRYWRTALKLRPLGIRVNEVLGLRGIEFAYDLRLFGNRFTSQDFGGPVDPDGSRVEFVNGMTVSIVW